MRQVTSLEEYQAAIQRLNVSRESFTSNFYGSHSLILTWIKRGVLFMDSAPDSLLLYRRDRNLYHLSHLAADETTLGNALAGLPSNVNLVLDLLGRPEVIPPLKALYQKYGFREYGRLVRMSHVGSGIQAGGMHPEVKYANQSDVPQLLAFMESLLDPAIEQIPVAADLEAWCLGKQILMVRCDDVLAGLLIFEKAGLSSVLRYWFVGEQGRNGGTGSKLIRSFLHLCRDCRRITLWVIADNVDSISKYEHYGFQRDILYDLVMLRTARPPEGVNLLKTILEICSEIRPEFDFSASEDFFSDGLLDSLDLITLVSDLDKTFGISIEGIEIIPENFQNLSAIQALLVKHGVAR